MAFVDVIPEEQVRQFQRGDMIFTQRLDSILSWAMMYVTSSPIDHSAIYAEDGNVLHMTLQGSKIHTLRSVAKGCRTLVVRMGPMQLARWMHESDRLTARIDKGSAPTRGLPPKIQLAIGALKAIHGKYHDRFKWIIWADFAFSITMISVVVFEVSGYLTSFIPSLSSVFFVFFYQSKNLFRRLLKRDAIIMSHPDLGYTSFFKAGGLMFTTVGPIAVLDIGLLPLKVVLSFARQRADDSSDDNFQKAREFFRNLVEGWNLVDTAQDAEDQNSQQENEKKI